MAIQGIQVPMYTKHTLLLYFSILFILFYIFIKKKKKSKLKRKTNKNKAMHKTRLTQNNKAKHTSNVNKNKKRREKKWQNHLEPFSFHTLEEPFSLANPWSGGEGEELKPFKFERNIRALRRSPRRAKEDGSWFWSLDAIMLLLFFWVANHL